MGCMPLVFCFFALQCVQAFPARLKDVERTVDVYLRKR